MKKKLHVLLFVAYLGLVSMNAQTTGITPVCNKQKSTWFSNNGTFDIGYYTTTVKPTGMQDFDISDYSIYGLKATDPNSKESRFRVPLANYFPSQFRMNGIYLGLRWNYLQKVQGGFTFRCASGMRSSQMTQFGLLISPQIFTYKRFRLVADFEYGGTSSFFISEELKPLNGYHPFLRAHDNFDLKEGSQVRIKNGDSYVQAGLNLQFALGEHVKAFSNVSFSRVFTTQSTEIAMTGDSRNRPTMHPDDIFIVRANESSTISPDLNVNFARTHAMLTFGFMFDLGGYPTDPAKPVKKCSCCGQVIPD